MLKGRKAGELSKSCSNLDESKPDGSSDPSRSEESPSQLASCCLISKDGTKTGQGVIVRRGKWVEDVGGPSSCSLVLITSHSVIADAETAEKDWHKITLGGKQLRVKFASCISCCGKDGILSKLSHGGEKECPFDCNFTFAFFGDQMTKTLEKVPNVYFPEIHGITSLNDITNELKEIRAGRASVYRCIRMKDGSTQELQLSAQHHPLSSPDDESDLSPLHVDQLHTTSAQSLIQNPPRRQRAAAMAKSHSRPCSVSLPVADTLPQSFPILDSPMRAMSGSSQSLSSSKEFPVLSHTTSNMFLHIRSYEKARLLKYGNDGSEGEGAPIYTVTQKGKRRMSLHAIRNHTLTAGDEATPVYHMINLAALKNGVRLADPYPYLSFLLNFKPDQCEIHVMSDCYTSASSQLTAFITDSQNEQMFEFTTADLCLLAHQMMNMINCVGLTMSNQSLDSTSIPEILEAYLDLLVHIFHVLRKKGENTVEQKSIDKWFQIFYEMLNQEDFKEANQTLVRKCLETLFLLTNLCSGELTTEDENVRLLYLLFSTYSATSSDTKTPAFDSSELDDISSLFFHPTLWNFLKGQVEEKEQLKNDKKELLKKSMQMGRDLAGCSQPSDQLQYLTEKFPKEQEDLQLKVKQLTTKYQQAQGQLKTSQERISELQRKGQEREQPNYKLQQQLQQVREKLDSTTKTSRNYFKERNTLQSQLDDVTHQRDSLQLDLKQCTKDKNALEQELQKLKQLRQSDEFERKILKRRYEEPGTKLSQGSEPATQQLQLEAKHRSLRIGELELENDQLKQNLEKANKKMEDVEQKLVRARAQALELQAQLLQQQQQKNWILPKEAITFTREEVGRGAYGSVQKATFRGLTVAAKVMHRAIMSEHNRQLFVREMSIITILHHPNLVQFIGATIDDSPTIITELLPTSLSVELDKGPLDNKDIHSIATDMALALNYLHCNDPPLIHRDVSPPNTLLEPTGNGWRAKLSDFGSTIFVSWRQTNCPGNLAYAAPEAYHDDVSQQSVKMDTYSFGVVVIEMCNRVPPLNEEREQQIRKIHWQEIATLVRTCCQTNASDRPNMTTVLNTLASLSLL